MGECIAPRSHWSLLNRQRHEQIERLVHGEDRKEEMGSSSLSHVQYQSSFSDLAPMSNHDVAKLTWENGQQELHEFRGMFPSSSSTSPPKWERNKDTLESIVRQATIGNRRVTSTYLLENNNNHTHEDVKNVCSVAASSEGGKYGGKKERFNGQVQASSARLLKKRARVESDDQINRCGRKRNLSFSDDEWADQRARASARAAFCGENSNQNNDDTMTMMTWASLESSRSTMRTKTTDEDSVCDHGGSEIQGEERETKGETATGRSSSTRRGRAAAIHNQSERRRRDMINQKMKALQKLVPNASKTDKASMLDEVIEYLKQLQAQVQMMASARTMSHLLMPLEMQHQLQMSILTRMATGFGPGMGMGILDTDIVNATTTTTTATRQHLASLIHPSFQLATNASSSFAPPPSLSAPSVVPPQQPNHEDLTNCTPSASQNPYNAFLPQVSEKHVTNVCLKP